MAVEITTFKPFTKNSLRGFITIRLTTIIDFFDKPKGDAFQKAALEALDQFLDKGGGRDGL